MTMDESKSVTQGPGAIYTCPMHPEVQQDHPGDCPKCGMKVDSPSDKDLSAKTDEK